MSCFYPHLYKQPKTPKKKGRKKGTKKMFTFRVEEKHHELLKEIAIYINSIP